MLTGCWAERKMADFNTAMPLCRDIDIQDLSIKVLQYCMRDGKFTATDLTSCYLERIRRLNGRLRCVSWAVSWEVVKTLPNPLANRRVSNLSLLSGLLLRRTRTPWVLLPSSTKRGAMGPSGASFMGSPFSSRMYDSQVDTLCITSRNRSDLCR